MIAFRYCPDCGHPLKVRSVQRVYGFNPLILTVEDGRLTKGAFTATEMDWNSADSVAYQCVGCGSDLPEDMQKVLDAALDNMRWEN